jgi:hypothetical protein
MVISKHTALLITSKTASPSRRTAHVFLIDHQAERVQEARHKMQRLQLRTAITRLGCRPAQRATAPRAFTLSTNDLTSMRSHSTTYTHGA